MKKILLSIVSVMAIVLSANAQLTINLSGTSTDIQGQSHNVPLIEAVWSEHLVDFLYNNETGSDQVWILTREIISQPADWGNYYCWGANGVAGTCYPPDAGQYYNSDPETILNGAAGLLTTYVTAPSSGTATYRYHVSTDGQTFLGYVDLIVENFLALEDQAPILTLNVAPNPASENLTINTPGISNTTIKMVDVLGNIVLKETIWGESKKIDVTKFRNGVYFVSVEAEGAKAVTRKVIVRH
ncbi:MAG: T9SS type A sorting domain-containing protein [Crocinitomicaceae bacterium]|nr:T9SS type A sorting domain-containing protein [Crocinitomicaceae bacterium]